VKAAPRLRASRESGACVLKYLEKGLCEHTFEEGGCRVEGLKLCFCLRPFGLGAADAHVGIFVDACGLGTYDSPQDVLEQRMPR